MKEHPQKNEPEKSRAPILISGMAAIKATVETWKRALAHLNAWMDEGDSENWRGAVITASEMFDLYCVELYVAGEMVGVQVDRDLLNVLAKVIAAAPDKPAGPSPKTKKKRGPKPPRGTGKEQIE